MKYYIVWNEKRNEGYITNDEDDASMACDGISPNAGVSTLAQAFRDAYAVDDDLDEDESMSFEVQEIELP